MKKLLLVAILLSSCNIKQKEIDRQFKIVVHHGDSFMNEYNSTIKCDSFNMISKQNIIFYVDGKKMQIIGEDISVSTSGIE
jgi:predicted small secreted protein